MRGTCAHHAALHLHLTQCLQCLKSSGFVACLVAATYHTCTWLCEAGCIVLHWP